MLTVSVLGKFISDYGYVLPIDFKFKLKGTLADWTSCDLVGLAKNKARANLGPGKVIIGELTASESKER
jgi:hypothetical protein